MVLFGMLVLLVDLALAQKPPVAIGKGYKVEILTSAICEMCKEAIESDLTFEKGVKSIDLDVETKVATIEYNPKKTTADKLRKRITLVGYHADNFMRDSVAYENLPFCCKDGAHDDNH